MGHRTACDWNPVVTDIDIAETPTLKWPMFRVRTAGPDGFFRNEPMFRFGGNGFRVIRFSRYTIDRSGEAVLAYSFGRIGDRLFGRNPSDDGPQAPDLTGRDVIIEYDTNTDPEEDPVWRVVWFGEILATDERAEPGSAVPSGEVYYHCRDGLWRTHRWIMDAHRVIIGGNDIGPCQGNPGYNTTAGDGIQSRIIGNKSVFTADPQGLEYDAHAWPGSASEYVAPWTTLEAIEHALASAVQPRNPTTGVRSTVFTVAGTLEILGTISAIEVAPNQDVLGFLRSVLDRRRSAGLAVLEWDTAASPESVELLAPRIVIYPALPESITWTRSSGGTETIPGATSQGTTAVLDCIGDPRFLDDGFQVHIEDETTYGAVETLGDRIVVVASFSIPTGTWAKYWEDDEADEMAATGALLSEDPRWAHVGRWVGVPQGWGMAAMYRRSGGQTYPLDVRTDAGTGALVIERRAGHVRGSPLMARIADQSPMESGWNYSANPAALFADAASYEVPRLATGPVRLYALGAGDFSTETDAITVYEAAALENLRVRVAPNGLGLLVDGQDGPYFLPRDPDEVAATCAIELGERIRLLSGDSNGRRKIVQVPGLALHLIHPGAIIGAEDSSDDGGPVAGSPQYAAAAPVSVALREDSGTSAQNFYRIRDDRDLLQYYHNLAVAWYTTRRASAQIPVSGLAFFDDEITGDPWPKLGHVLTQLTYSGQIRASINTPITGIEFDNAADGGDCKSVIITSWSDRDWRPR